MPLSKPPRNFTPLWKEADIKAQKKGQRDTVYSVCGDTYTGEWKDNKKSGKGTKVWKKTGAVYDGDWKNDMRNGFGTYSIPNPPHGFRKVYAGGWKNDKKHGYGTRFYGGDEFYEGEWYADKRSGWGRMYFNDGSIYEGEWLNDMRNGSGMLRLANENRYEGSWKDDMKHGTGLFYFLDKGQILKGTWIKDISKCGEVEDFDREHASNATEFPIPECTVKDPKRVLADAKSIALEADE